MKQKKIQQEIDQVQRVNVDFGLKSLHELDQVAIELNVSRQAIIKLFIQRELDRHFLAKKARFENEIQTF